MENGKEIEIIIILTVGTLIMFLLAGVIVFFVLKYQKKILSQKEALRLIENKYQNDILSATIAASENEREKFAKNMHDEVGTLINVIKLNNSRLKNESNKDPSTLEVLNSNNQILSEISESVRSITNDLMSPTLKKLGFIRALQQLANQINSSNSVSIHITPEELNVRFKNEIEIQLFRICKELINNILKHSNSSEIAVEYILNKDIFSIIVNYNGKGINDGDAKRIIGLNTGLGLKNLYARIQILNGTINYYTEKNQNASILIKLSIKE